ncbi:4-hydroxyphenylacetate 3-monooxygenase, oxygenase component [Bacillus infantis]|uniref:4-hydroxyphenylacetate 3-monooxygenase, oxygenase component n=1 Tax=Bacillus infantis TaxID=324767 RepID=UPI00209CCBB7|nr:4-hydroxyphenylacetate 3-monooxygenase, oxygenase component [Bacillus infantis]MCP1160939.1 4-hydroxyphenylacetate 3-monooxygenase, oxygenase component [Bacillus infantis]
MGIRNGKEFIERLDLMENEVWLDGERVAGKISEHPAFKGIVTAKASLYDKQCDPPLQEELTFRIPGTAELAGLSYLRPQTKEDLLKRRKMTEHWAMSTHGMMGRSPDYLNTAVMSLAASASVLAGRENCFPGHVQALYERAIHEDLSFTHTLITPQVNRSAFYLGSDTPISAKVVEKNHNGLVIKGARLLATQGGLTDELLVLSSPGRFDTEEAFAFSIPSNTDGLRFICRGSFAGDGSAFDYPLSSHYDEMDAIVVFDDVLVPWERVFLYDNVEAALAFKNKSSFHSFAYHQALIRQIVKTEFILGIAESIVKCLNVSEYQHIQAKMAEIIIGLESMKALLEKSENDAIPDEFGCMRPSIVPLQIASNLFPELYPRFCEIIQVIGASGLTSLPTEKDFESGIRADLDQYLQAEGLNAKERVQLFRLAWDLTMSPFGTRQTHYERYFSGDPVRLASTLYHTYPKEDFVRNISEFLQQRKSD